MIMVLRSTRVLFEGQIQPADIVLEHDYIKNVLSYKTQVSAIDMGDLLIVPGFIDLHSDAVEKEIEPRPGAAFPARQALVEMDKKLAMAGITTMFHAISFNDESVSGQRGTEPASDLINLIHEMNQDLLFVDNMVHARYEITSFNSIPDIKNHINQGQVHLLSFMDHSPGQGQFSTITQWRDYYLPTFQLSPEEGDEIISRKLIKKQQAYQYLHDLSTYAQENNILIASHDDDSTDKVEFMKSMGVSIAEFPLNIETARFAQAHKVATGMGAPNIVRGKSQSGNISARELISEGLCNYICSDYHPSAMLQAVFTLHKEMNYSLEESLRFITDTPAEIARMSDRGNIAPGKLADLIVIDDKLVPRVVMTLKSGNMVYNSSNCFCFKKAA